MSMSMPRHGPRPPSDGSVSDFRKMEWWAYTKRKQKRKQACVSVDPKAIIAAAKSRDDRSTKPKLIPVPES